MNNFKLSFDEKSIARLTIRELKNALNDFVIFKLCWCENKDEVRLVLDFIYLFEMKVRRGRK